MADQNVSSGPTRVGIFVRLLKAVGEIVVRYWYVFPQEWEYAQCLKKKHPTEETPTATAALLPDVGPDDWYRLGSMIWNLADEQADGLEHHFHEVGQILDSAYNNVEDDPTSVEVWGLEVLKPALVEETHRSLYAVMSDRVHGAGEVFKDNVRRAQPHQQAQELTSLNQGWLVQRNLREVAIKDVQASWQLRMELLTVVERVQFILDLFGRISHKLSLLRQEGLKEHIEVLNDFENFLKNTFPAWLRTDRLGAGEFDEVLRGKLQVLVSKISSNRGIWHRACEKAHGLNRKLMENRRRNHESKAA